MVVDKHITSLSLKTKSVSEINMRGLRLVAVVADVDSVSISKGTV